MDSPYNSNNNTSRVSKLQNFKGHVSPLNTQRDNNHYQFFIGGGPTFDPYTSSFDKSSLESVDPAALIRYLRSVSPASPDTVIGVGGGGFGSPLTSPPLRAVDSLVETPPSRSSPQVFSTPVKVVEEDVLVMDGIPVGGSGSGGRMRFSSGGMSSCGSNSGAHKREICRMRFPVSSDSSGGMSSSGSNSSAYKREICRSWEDSSYCRHGSKCQFAHGKEEVHPPRFLRKTKSEICNSYSGSGSCSYGAKCRFSHHNVITSSPTERAVAAVKVAKTRSNSPFKPENLNFSISSSGSTTTSGGGSETLRSSITVTNTDWSPMDDGIMVSLPSPASANEIPSREAVDAYINSVLYGPPRGKRLPVFAEICPESPSPFLDDPSLVACLRKR